MRRRPLSFTYFVSILSCMSVTVSTSVGLHAYHPFLLADTEVCVYDVLYAQPNTTVVRVGSTFNVTIGLCSGSEMVNRFAGSFAFSWTPTILSLEGFLIFYGKPFINTYSSSLSAHYASPPPAASLLCLYFRALNSGSTILSFSNASCLTKDGSADVLSDKIVHNLDTGLNYGTIQEAIDANETERGHTITVSSGTYCESIVLGKPDLQLIGEGIHTTTIESQGTVVYLSANGSAISGFTIRNGYCGVQMSPWSHGHTISNNHIVNNDYGISGHYDCQKANISYNVIAANNISGIEMLFSNSIVSYNQISCNGGGDFKEYSSGIQIAKGVNSHDVYCANNTVFGNIIDRNRVGILALHYSESNFFWHNNFVDNQIQVSVPTGEKWNNTARENYWSNYDGRDGNRDGFGDTPHIEGLIIDECPLVGRFSSFEASEGSRINIIANSSIDSFQFFGSNSSIRIHVSSSDVNQSHGFCVMCLPHNLMNVSSIQVIIDGGAEPALHSNYDLRDNGTHRWIYFAYSHNSRQIDVVPEFPTSHIPPLLLLVLCFLSHARLKAKSSQRPKIPL